MHAVAGCREKANRPHLQLALLRITSRSQAAFSDHVGVFIRQGLPSLWEEPVPMLQALQLFSGTAQRVTPAVRRALSQAYPLILRAAVWNPAVLGAPGLDLLPILVRTSTLASWLVAVRTSLNSSVAFGCCLSYHLGHSLLLWLHAIFLTPNDHCCFACCHSDHS